MVQPAFLTIPQAGEYLGVKRSSIYRLLGESRLKGVRLRGRRLITVASLEALATELTDANCG